MLQKNAPAALLHSVGHRCGLTQRSRRVLGPHVNTLSCWCVWAGLGFLGWFVTFKLLDVWSEEIVLRHYLMLSVVIPPPSRHCPVVSATHHRDMFKTFSSPNTTHWKIWGMLGPGVQGPPGSLNKINDISGKISFGVITRDALKWNLGANKNNCLFVMAHTNLTTDIIGKHFRMTCLFLLPSIFVNQIETPFLLTSCFYCFLF